ncbi:TerB family tellurite resistance protein [Curtobacterium aurantiacum]|uniref:TerB family tellurite resistance protein n=1 Tax=Curtobacterium aurantiacum TaxID=3236919 RepID=UPI001BE0CCA8|nr:TerB family tellurite resistance protein [Curtobacterium flaccumfaciens]MBT1677019.1 TerB family tellurite resistance protein [Curtobacterium flaccumfaciens pv. flaccumfaciens]
MMKSAQTDATEDERAEVENEREELKDFVKSLTGDDIKSGNWFSKLLSNALAAYTQKVDAAYFQERYKGVPADAIVDQRIKMAARYAAIEGGLSAGAYTAAVVATLGTLGGASPLTLPAAGVTLLVDVAYIARLQLHLAYDIAVLYRVPINVDDPDDLWKLIRVAFTIRGAQAVSEGVTKVVPALVRPFVKKFYSRAVLTTARGLPVVGKFLLQRNVIKIGIPIVGVPVSVALNYYSTIIAGKHARAVFRNDARVDEAATNAVSKADHPRSMLWVAWMMVLADGKITDDEALLMRKLVEQLHDQHDLNDDQFANVIDLDVEDVWRRLDEEAGDLADLLDVAVMTAEVDGSVHKLETAVLKELRDRHGDRLA